MSPIKHITNVGGDGMKVVTTIPDIDAALALVMRVCADLNISLEHAEINGNDDETWIQVVFKDAMEEHEVVALEVALEEASEVAVSSGKSPQPRQVGSGHEALIARVRDALKYDLGELDAVFTPLLG